MPHFFVEGGLTFGPPTFILRTVPVLGGGAGSIPATGLALLATLFLTRWLGQRLLEVSMTLKPTKTTTCPATRLTYLALSVTSYCLETIWAIGASVVAAMVPAFPSH